MRRSHFRYYYRYYRPWINCNQYTGTYHYNKQQQIAQFCKKAKKIIKDNNAQAATGSVTAVTSNNTGTTATPTSSSSPPPPKNLRRKKKDNVGTTTGTTSTSNSNSNQYHETRILVPLSEQYRNVLAVRASSPNGAAPPSPTMTCVYVHPLSQMVLLYLQSYCHDWVQARQLQHLNLQVDGTFRVRSVGVPTTTAPPLRRSTLIHRDALVNNGAQPTMTATTRHEIPRIIQIWTKYEKEERKHWLCAAVVTDHSNTTTKSTNHHGNSPFDDMVEPKWQNRYLLQDNTVTPWQSYSQQRGGGTPERIQSHVQALIRAVDAALVEPTSV